MSEDNFELINPESFRRAFGGIAYVGNDVNGTLDLHLCFRTAQGYMRMLSPRELFMFKVDFPWMANLQSTIDLNVVQSLDVEVAQVCSDEINELSQEAIKLLTSLGFAEDNAMGKCLGRVKNIISLIVQKNAQVKLALTNDQEFETDDDEALDRVSR